MATQPSSALAHAPGLPAQQAYAIAAVCLLIGLMAGHFLLGSPKSPALARTQPSSNAALANVPPGNASQIDTRADEANG